MGNFNKSEESPLKYVKIEVFPESHIAIRAQKECTACENKPCTYYCPTRVYSWEDEQLMVDYTRCIECGTCPFGCPNGNIHWKYPPGGYG